MLPKEIISKIRRIHITTSRLVTDFLSGQYESVFKGRGIEFDEVREYQPGDEVKAFAEEIIKGTYKHLAEINKLIHKCAKNWSLDRMAVVDRNVLRMAVYEILHRMDIPTSVTINEAIEIAKKFGTEESGSFVNGILDNVARTTGNLDEGKTGS